MPIKPLFRQQRRFSVNDNIRSDLVPDCEQGSVLFKNALNRTPQPIPPIWMMRQAGRYHSHYQALRKVHGFETLCKNPQLAAEVALGPIEDFDFDVAILFSDILYPLEAMGIGLKFDPGPIFEWSLNKSTLGRLKSVDASLPSMMFQAEAVLETRRRLPINKSLVGFVGGPWTLFGYAVEGRHQGGLAIAKREMDLYKEFKQVLNPLLEKIIRLQIENGAELVMIFDTAAGELSAQQFTEVIAPDIARLSRLFPNRLAYYARGIQKQHLNGLLKLYDSQLAGFGFDHRWNLSEVLRSTTQGIVQGNFDQSMMLMPPQQFKMALIEYLDPLQGLSIQERAGWVCGLGHGVLPGTPEENVRDFVRTVRESFAGSR
jgi:uroporphyrinogen decarboxylase